MKKLFALLIAAGCLTSYNAMAQEKNNMTEFKSSPQKYSNYRAPVPAEEKLPIVEGEYEGNADAEDALLEVEEVVSDAEENISKVQEELEETATEMEEKVTLPTEVTE